MDIIVISKVYIGFKPTLFPKINGWSTCSITKDKINIIIKIKASLWLVWAKAIIDQGMRIIPLPKTGSISTAAITNATRPKYGTSPI